MTALFADIAGSTSLGERLAPHLVRLIVGSCISKLTAIVEQFEGCVTAHMGDGIAAFFGLEGAHEDDPQRAALAALEMIKAVEAFGREIATAWEADDFAIRVGINAGRVATARIGAGDPAKHALGDPVNVAARLQALAPLNGVLVGGEAASQLDERFGLNQLEPVAVKGREERVSAWELRAFDPSARKDLSAAPLIGREVECRALDSVAADVLAGRGRIILLTGDAGIGKSRLLAEFRRMVGSKALWLEASCAGQGVSAPFKPVADLVRYWANVGHDLPRMAARVCLQHALEQSGLPDTDALLAGFEWLLDVREEDHGFLPWDEQRSPEAIRTEIRHAIASWVRYLAAEGPVIFALEDVEKIDVSTRSMVDDLMDHTDADGLSLIVALRPDSYSEGWGVRVRALAEYAHRAREVPVLPLTSAATRDLIAALDEPARLRGEARERVVLAAEGNPLFTEQLYRSLVSRPDSGDSCDGYGEEIPMGLEGLLLARIDQLAPKTQAVVQCAAAVGRVFSVDVVAAALGVGPIARELKELLKSGLITEHGRYPDRRYEFRHGLLREAALSTLLPEHRQDLHRRIAETLERVVIEGERFDSLAYHCALGHLWDKAARFFGLAAQYAIQLDAVDEGLDLLGRAWEAARETGDGEPILHAGISWGRLLIDTGRTTEAIGVLQKTLDVTPDGMGGGIHAALAECLADVGRVDDACSMLERSDSTIRQDDPNVLYARAHVAFRKGDFGDVIEKLRYLEDVCSAAGCLLGDIRRKIAWLWGGLCAVKGDFRSAWVWTVERREIAKSSGDSLGVLSAERDLGVLAICCGELDEAREVLEDVWSYSMRLGYKKQMCGAAVNLLYAYWLKGDFVSGVDFSEGVKVWEEAPQWRGELLGGMAGILVGVGDLEGAGRMYREAIEISNDPWVDVALRVRLSLLRLAQGEREGAETELREMVEELVDTDARLEQRSWARLGLAEIAISRGDGEVAEREAGLALEDAERAERPARVAPLRVRGIAKEVKVPSSGREDLEHALALAREMGMRLEEGRALAALAQFGLGDRSSLVSEAKHIFEECGAQPDLQALEEQERAAGAGAV